MRLNGRVSDFWIKHYLHPIYGCCVVCGNSGVLDSRGAKTAAGVEVGTVTYCFCPNGQALRKGRGILESRRDA